MGAIIPPNEKREYIPLIQSDLGKISQRAIARKLGIGRTTVNNWSKELGFKYKKHTVNENFFDEFSEKSAYLLGLIFADGNIAWNPKKGYQALTITACEKDRDHLENLRNILSSTKPLLYAPKTKSYRLIVNNKKICQRLMSLSLTPRKSLTVRFPNIPKKYIRHFIRGIIDGDGTVRYVDREKSPYFEIVIFSGSKLFCKDLAQVIKKEMGIKTNVRKVKRNAYVLQYSCSRGKKLAQFIYSDATLFLPRKYLIYKNKVIGGKRK